MASDPDDGAELYLNSLYFMILTVTTLGYGSNAYDVREVIGCMILQIIGVVGYASLSGLLANHLTALDSKKADQQQKLDILESM